MSDIIYWTMVDTPQTLLGSAEGFLSASELEKLSSLHFPKRRDEWLLGRWAAKQLVQSIPTYQHYSLEEIEIRNAPEGAPYILPPGGSVSLDCLSISHRDQFALCAMVLGGGLRIGADLETVEPRTGAFIADYFTAGEQKLVDACPVEVRQAAVSLIWSAKESMLKALGVGLHWDTRRVEVREIAGSLSGSAGHGKWHKLEVADQEQADRPWLAWWQQRGPFILTLAGFTRASMDNPTAQVVEKWIRQGLK